MIGVFVTLHATTDSCGLLAQSHHNTQLVLLVPTDRFALSRGEKEPSKITHEVGLLFVCALELPKIGAFHRWADRKATNGHHAKAFPSIQANLIRGWIFP